MKKVTAYRCDYCKKMVVNSTQMKRHEEVCFYNPVSRSCVTCESLSMVPFVNNKKLTEHEFNILKFRVKGTYIEKQSPDSFYYVLNDEYKYLNEAVDENYCKALDMQLKKLRTQCSHNLKIK